MEPLYFKVNTLTVFMILTVMPFGVGLNVKAFEGLYLLLTLTIALALLLFVKSACCAVRQSLWPSVNREMQSDGNSFIFKACPLVFWCKLLLYTNE